MRGWLTPKPDPEFESKCAEVCTLYHEAPAAAQQDVRTVSVDEMTGVQALERAAPDLPVQPGKVARREFEYIRHGTQTVIAAFDIATGQVTASVGETRTEQDYANFLDTLFAAGAPTTKWRVIADNLNTHVSESVQYRGRPRRKGQVRRAGFNGHARSFSARPKPQDPLSLHTQTRFLAQPDRDLVLHPRAQTPAPRQLHFQRTPEGSHRSLHRLFQSHPRKAVQVDHDRKTARRMSPKMGFVLPARCTSFVGEVMAAAKKAGHIGDRFSGGKFGRRPSTFGRGRRVAALLSLHSTSRRVVMKARVVRHRGSRFRSAALSKHIGYLEREGVTRDGADARMFDAGSDTADERAFAERCEEDRHHFRFIVSPEDAADMESLRTFTRELMKDVERDLGTRLDWLAVDHWNTDNPHMHVLIRGRGDDGRDLVISRDYISRGFRDRAAERVTLELGPRSEQQIRASLEKEIEADRWTSLDRALRDLSDEGGGVVDLRPGGDGDQEMRRLMLGRAAKLERLGLAERVGPAQWTLKPGLEPALRDLGIRGDIIKTMHQAMSAGGREPDVGAFVLHSEEPSEPVLGRLVKRGLDDELEGDSLRDRRWRR